LEIVEEKASSSSFFFVLTEGKPLSLFVVCTLGFPTLVWKRVNGSDLFQSPACLEESGLPLRESQFGNTGGFSLLIQSFGALGTSLGGWLEALFAWPFLLPNFRFLCSTSVLRPIDSKKRKNYASSAFGRLAKK